MRYLSEAWFVAAEKALVAAGPPPAALVLDQHVTNTVYYRFTFDRRGATLHWHHLADDPLTGVERPAAFTEPADAVFTQSATVAAAIASGTADAHSALLLGQIDYEGQSSAIIENRSTLTWLHDVLAPVIDQTEFDHSQG